MSEKPEILKRCFGMVASAPHKTAVCMACEYREDCIVAARAKVARLRVEYGLSEDRIPKHLRQSIESVTPAVAKTPVSVSKPAAPEPITDALPKIKREIRREAAEVVSARAKTASPKITKFMKELVNAGVRYEDFIQGESLVVEKYPIPWIASVWNRLLVSPCARTQLTQRISDITGDSAIDAAGRLSVLLGVLSGQFKLVRLCAESDMIEIVELT